eukprot:TRINITY_DN15741_c0_g1_i2.p1 TRINITY_DN15741_c0_g1~~TRINITY_DN15741_c0_g1_i2.p1  ORF type:complete len:154 (+),score=24.27 TRINITY_DN15741_c0_g1_i2:1310-1771(+)
MENDDPAITLVIHFSFKRSLFDSIYREIHLYFFERNIFLRVLVNNSMKQMAVILYLFFFFNSSSFPCLNLMILFMFSCPATILGAVPAGIYAKVHYGTSLSNVDWLHGSAESLLTLTNLFIVMGLMEALRKEKQAKETASKLTKIEEEKQSSV